MAAVRATQPVGVRAGHRAAERARQHRELVNPLAIFWRWLDRWRTG